MKSKSTPAIKRYAVFGLMEYVARIPAGARAVSVHFAGGQMSGYGIRPAVFETADPVLQRLIEASPDFRRGKIKKI